MSVFCEPSNVEKIKKLLFETVDFWKSIELVGKGFVSKTLVWEGRGSSGAMIPLVQIEIRIIVKTPANFSCQRSKRSKLDLPTTFWNT